jgi:hypothetical protein
VKHDVGVSSCSCPLVEAMVGTDALEPVEVVCVDVESF